MGLRISLRDIALKAGVSHVTVSRALRNQANVSKATRSKIRAAARRLGYQPDAELSALMTRCRQKNILNYRATLAWVTSWQGEQDLHCYRYWSGACREAGKLGYQLERFPVTDTGLNFKRICSILDARNVRGIILPPQPHSHTHFQCDWEHYAVVALGFSVSPARFHIVTNAQARSSALAMRNLFQSGHRRVGFLQNEEGLERTDNNFLSGFLVEQRQLGKKDQISPFIYRCEDLGRAESHFRQWVRRERPTVILHNDENVAPWLERFGFAVPRDIGLAYLNTSGSDASPSTSPVPTGIDQKEELIGAKAAELLISMVQRGEFGVPETPLRILVEGAWREGGTVLAGVKKTNSNTV